MCWYDRPLAGPRFLNPLCIRFVLKRYKPVSPHVRSPLRGHYFSSRKTRIKDEHDTRDSEVCVLAFDSYTFGFASSRGGEMDGASADRAALLGE